MIPGDRDESITGRLMPRRDEDAIVVLGGGMAGGVAARTLREEGHDVR